MADLYEQLKDSIDTLTPEQIAELMSLLGAKGSKQIKKSNDNKEPYKDPTDNDMKACVHCGSVAIKKNGTKNGRQRYRCKDCDKSFCSASGTLAFHSRLTPEQWKELIRGLVENLSLTKIAKNVGVSTATAWLNKQKVCKALMDLYGVQDNFTDIAECDEYYVRTSFKGKRDARFFVYTLGRLPRHHRSLEEKIQYLMDNNLWDELQADQEFLNSLLFDDSYRRGISIDQTCIVTCKDRSGHLYISPACLGRPETTDIKNELQGKFASDAILVTDSHNAYPAFAHDEKVQHEQIEAGKHANGAFNLGRINGLHSKISKQYSKDGQRLPATKYLEISLMLFWWLEKNGELSTTEQVDELYDIISNNKGLENVTRESTRNTELNINTKGYIPKKV